MRQKGFVFVPVIIIIVLLGIVGYFVYQDTQLKNSKTNLTTPSPTIEISICVKENNCCDKNNDCEYFWYTGGCQTPEYVSKVNEENAKIGLRPGESPPFDGKVNCTCESKKCIARDSHGCLIFASKSTWCAVQEKCLSSLTEECK